jgi:putative membrane protein
MTGWQFFLAGWDWEPSVIVGCVLLLVSYLAMMRFRVTWRTLSFASGTVVLFLALVSPLDSLADSYLFSAHMVQHILLILIVPPLWILGIPPHLLQKMLRRPTLAKIEHRLTFPVLAWSLGVGSIWLWHWPPLYNAALAHEPLHIAEHLVFLSTAAIFWWPVIAPLERLRLAPLWAAVYVFAACTAHTVLAILITFAPLGIYPAYLQPADAYNILPLLRGSWALGPAADQQWGGLLMWVPACAVYLAFILASLARWYRAPEEMGTTRTLPAAASAFAVADPKVKDSGV